MQFNNSYATLDTRLFHIQPPTPLEHPQAGHFNPIIADRIGWSDDDYLMDNWIDILGGKVIPTGFAPLAMAYAGHQFGHWAGQLGDGRGLLMAQVIDKNGELTDLHLKGVGLTPYSRRGDGRAVLRSTIREYLCGHAMTSLGIRSSSALGFIVSKTQVRRETIEPAAALMRVSDSHVRLGHVEWIASFAPDLLSSFTDYMIDIYYPECRAAKNPVLAFLTAVVERTAVMIANWQLIGFAHGVMNTDNLSITGSTIDYGPFGFLERFNPAWINNHSDHTGRYSYQNQPAIGHWNLNLWLSHFLRLNSAGVTREGLENCLAHYQVAFSQHYQQGLCHKLGLPYTVISNHNHSDTATDASMQSNKLQQTSLVLAQEFLDFLENNELDFTNSFRALIGLVNDISTINEDASEAIDSTATDEKEVATRTHDAKLLKQLEDSLTGDANNTWLVWKTRYLAHLNAVYQLESNHLEDSINRIDNNSADNDEINTTTNEQSITSITHTQQHTIFMAPLALMHNQNPIYILRNAMAQIAIEKGESGDFSEVDRLFHLLTKPYTLDTSATAKASDTQPPALDSPELVISCSS